MNHIFEIINSYGDEAIDKIINFEIDDYEEDTINNIYKKNDATNYKMWINKFCDLRLLMSNEYGENIFGIKFLTIRYIKFLDVNYLDILNKYRNDYDDYEHTLNGKEIDSQQTKYILVFTDISINLEEENVFIVGLRYFNGIEIKNILEYQDLLRDK